MGGEHRAHGVDEKYAYATHYTKEMCFLLRKRLILLYMLPLDKLRLAAKFLCSTLSRHSAVALGSHLPVRTASASSLALPCALRGRIVGPATFVSVTYRPISEAVGIRSVCTSTVIN
jgi:hypothetical protein